MKSILVIAISLFCLSFTKTEGNEEANDASDHKNGYYILVEDYTDRTNHKYLVESKDSVDVIFNNFFESQLALGKINYPISIDNGQTSFFVARVKLFESRNGKTKFKHLKYPKIYNKRKQQDPTEF
ncbi:hypothetical protein [uncultured Sunxiuqinia sp.]|uniref:hypothetical protein n=1 Tax=uncultured Sunxiuqinia sp. TaxID=1573825 RepID=UPI002AA8CEC2|nr:hypothetical protein [uncultured Sunxiuqinia sp.]